MADPQVKVGLSMHVVDAETSQVQERPVAVKLPKWVWGILQARADYCHDGNLDEAFSEIVGLGLQTLGEQVTINETPIPTDPKCWN